VQAAPHRRGRLPADGGLRRPAPRGQAARLRQGRRPGVRRLRRVPVPAAPRRPARPPHRPHRASGPGAGPFPGVLSYRRPPPYRRLEWRPGGGHFGGGPAVAGQGGRGGRGGRSRTVGTGPGGQAPGDGGGVVRRLIWLRLFALVLAGGAVVTWKAMGQARLVQEDLTTARALLARAG